MAKVFTNYYAFPAGLVPAAETFRDRLASQFGHPLEMEKQERGFQGAPRAYASLRGDKMQIWIYWEPDRPDVEVMVDEPMMRMIPINAAIGSLGGKPTYADASWKSRHRYRIQRTIHRVIVLAGIIALAIAAVWHLHWWGVLLIIGAMGIAACLYTMALARAFSNR